MIGLLVGYYGGIADIVFGRLVDLVVTFPFLVLVIAIVAVLGPGLCNMYIAIGVVGWVFYARLMRAEVLVLRGQDYVAAARILGYGERRILLPPHPAQRGHADPRLLDDRHGARHPARLQPRLSRPRRAAAGGRVGRADRRRQELLDARHGGSRCSPASPSCSPASASASPATASPTCWGPAMSAPVRGRCSTCGTCSVTFATPRGDARRRRRRRPRRRAGRGARPRRRVRLGQERDAALDPAAAARAGARSAARSTGRAATCWRMPRAASCASVRGARDRHDLPGADDGAQPGAADRRCRSRRASSAHTGAGRARRAGARALELLNIVGIPAAAAPARRAIRTSFPAACASA